MSSVLHIHRQYYHIQRQSYSLCIGKTLFDVWWRGNSISIGLYYGDKKHVFLEDFLFKQAGFENVHSGSESVCYRLEKGGWKSKEAEDDSG